MFLFAEDDPDDQFLIYTIAKEVCPPELKLHFVKNGVELLNFLQEKVDGSFKPRLIVLDLNMPRKDGREALKDIKNDPNLADIPTVILTTSSREEDLEYCSRYGIEGYYQKSGPASEWREMFEKFCEDYL